MQFSPYFEDLFCRFNNKVSFVVVYITEAHAADEWPVGKTVSFTNQPKTVEERMVLAEKYTEKLNSQIPVVVDTMENEFERRFAAWPMRWYIVQGGRLVFKPQPAQSGYNPREIEAWLEEHC